MENIPLMVYYGQTIPSRNVHLDHRCPFPIGWLVKKEGFEEIPLTTALFDDRWD